MILDVAIRCKRFGAGAPVLRDLAFSLAAGEILALVGPSGCGKTTLLKIIGGLDTAFEGSLRWPGLAQPRIGTVFQEPRLLPWRSLRDNLRLVLPPERHAAADALLHELGLWEARDRFPTQISLGMARRAAIARAFAIVPDLVLMDEPFVSLDPEMAERGRAVLRTAWQARPTAGLLVTHDLADAAALADRVLLLSGQPTAVASEIVIPDAQRRGSAAMVSAVSAALRAAQHALRG